MQLVTESTTRVLPIRETLAGKSVLVTGVTGFLGKVWVSMLLHEVPEIGHSSRAT